MSLKECEKVYGNLIKEDENFYWFEGTGKFNVCIPKNSFFLYQPERSKREDKCFVIMGSKECIAMDAVLSDESKQYMNNSHIQINHNGKKYLMRCSEHDGNIVREVQ